MFAARCKDNNEKPNRVEATTFRDEFLKHCTPEVVKLRALRLGQNSCAAILKSLKQHPHIQELDLHGNQVKDAGVFQVSSVIEAVPGLVKLDIGANDIRNDGAKHLASTLDNNDALESLELGTWPSIAQPQPSRDPNLDPCRDSQGASPINPNPTRTRFRPKGPRCSSKYCGSILR